MTISHPYSRPKWGHFVSVTTEGESCSMCGLPAAHKVAEQIPPDDPSQENTQVFPRSGRFPLAAYVCCFHFAELLGSATGCRT